jgi:DNA-binding NarL/FixJ family response regulator
MTGVALIERGIALDEQELEILRLLADGLVLDTIARRMSLSERTLRRRIRSLCDRFGVDAPVQVVVIAARNGLL